MSGFLHLMRCVGRAALKNGGRALASLVPFGEVLFEIARDARADYRQEHGDDDTALRADLEGLAAASPAAARAAAEQVAREEAAGASAAIRLALVSYLGQMPATIGQSLRRPSDPRGRTVPADLPLRDATDLLPFLPAGLPRFKPGDHPLPGVDWELEQMLGVGGFGEVWKARNPHLASVPPVALKFCLDATAARVLRNEAAVLDRVMRQGHHPGIVQLLRTYLSAEVPCLEYEYVEGGDLTGLLREWHATGSGPTPEQAAAVVLRLAETVGHAHRLSPPIVHRDLKPANILVQRSPGGVFEYKVGDFGIGGVAADQALQQARGGTTRGQLLASAAHGSFTPLYASPQQMRGEPPDPRDDVYALGVIWYQLLTGDLAAGRPGGSRWRQKLAERGVPTAAADLLESCFEDSPGDRPPDAAALAEALARLSGRGTAPPPPVSAPAPVEVVGEVLTLTGHQSPSQSSSGVKGVAFFAGVQYAVSCGGDGTLRLWDLGAGREARSEKRRVTRLSPDGRRIACLDDRGYAVEDLYTRQTIARGSRPGQGSQPTAIAFSPDGELLAHMWTQGPLLLVDLPSGRERRLEWCVGYVVRLGVSTGGRFVLAGNQGKTLGLWDVAAERQICRLDLGAKDAWVGADPVFSPDGRHALYTETDPEASSAHTVVRVLDLSVGEAVCRLAGHAATVLALAFSPDGRHVFSAGEDGLIHQWRIPGGQEVRRFQGHAKAVRSLAVSPDGRSLLSGGDDTTVRLWVAGERGQS